MSRRTALAYAALMLVNAEVTTLVSQVVAGQVPIPPGYLWLVPLLLPLLQIAPMFLPSAVRDAGAVDQVRKALTPELILQAMAKADEDAAR